LVWWGNRRHWHDRWLSYRLLAELVRQLRAVIPLGGSRPLPRPGQSLDILEDPSNSWMYWHLRSIDREVGLPEAKITTEHLRDCLGYVATHVKEQIDFHKIAAQRSGRIQHRLHSWGLWLFSLTFVLVAVHFAVHCKSSWHDRFHEGLDNFGLLFFCASFPALGAALSGINHQGEFARIARRSRAMAARLTQVKAELEVLLEPRRIVRSNEAAAHALQAAQIMVDEVLDWRVVFLDRPLGGAV